MDVGSNVRPWLVALLCTAAGCTGCDGGDGGIDPDLTGEHPEAGRYPRARLPWPVRTDEFDRDGYATFIGRRIHFAPRDNFSDYHEWEGALTAVVALDDRVVVVFPPADRDGFDLAVGGRDLPWERIPLADVLPKDIGDLDAVRDRDGTVWIAMRRRLGDQAITLYRWRPGEAVTSESVARPFTPTAFPFHDTCDDLALGVGPTGRQDLVFQQVDSMGRSQVSHVTRANASAPWQHEVVIASVTQLGDPGLNRFYSVGCRNVLAYEESGRPTVITMDQNLHTQARQGQITPLPIPIIRSYSMFLGADGAWLRARRGSLPDEREVTAGAMLENWDDTDDSYVAQIDLERHPEGFLVAGPSLPPANETLRWGYSLIPLSLTYDFAAVNHRNHDHVTTQPENFDLARSGGKLLIDECGRREVYGQYFAAGQWFTRIVAAAGDSGCAFTRQAPVIAEDVADDARFPNHAKGDRPYDVAVCIDGADQLVICHGAFRPGDAKNVFEPDELPQIAAIEPADLQLTGMTPIVIRLTRPPAPGEEAHYTLLRTLDAERIDHTPVWDLETGTLTITPAAPWPPGVAVRVSAWYASEDRAPALWMYGDTPRPVAVLRAGSAPHVDDPRDVTPRLACDLGGFLDRASDGVCTFVAPYSPASGHNARIVVPYDLARASSDPWLEDPNGSIVPSDARVIAGVFAIEWLAPLEGNARYEIVLPDDSKNLVGGSIHPDDRRIGLPTSAPLPTVTSTPASGTTGVDRDAPIVLVFNTPVTVPGTSVQLTTGASSESISILQIDPVTFQISHGQLAAMTSYTLTLGAGITNADGQPLTGAPVLITFTTGS
jgi:hypothetical protein